MVNRPRRILLRSTAHYAVYRLADELDETRDSVAPPPSSGERRTLPPELRWVRTQIPSLADVHVERPHMDQADGF